MTDPMSAALLVFGGTCFTLAVGEIRARKNDRSKDRETDSKIGHDLRDELRTELERKSRELDKANLRIEQLEAELCAEIEARGDPALGRSRIAVTAAVTVPTSHRLEHYRGDDST